MGDLGFLVVGWGAWVGVLGCRDYSLVCVVFLGFGLSWVVALVVSGLEW